MAEATAVVAAPDASAKPVARASSAAKTNVGCGWEEPAAQRRTAPAVTSRAP